MGLSLDTIRLMLNKYDNTQVIRKYLDMFYNQKLKEYNELKYQLNLIDTAINQLKNGNFCMDHNIVVKTLLERQVAHYTEKNTLWNMLRDEIEPQCPKFENPPYNLVIFHDEGFKEDDPEIEIQTIVLGKYKNTKKCYL